MTKTLKTRSTFVQSTIERKKVRAVRRLVSHLFEDLCQLPLEHMLALAKPISKQSTGEISLGSVAQLRTADDREYCYTVVGAYEAKPSAGLISHESPVGKALLGHKVGDSVMVSTPGGVKEYTILGIE